VQGEGRKKSIGFVDSIESVELKGSFGARQWRRHLSGQLSDLINNRPVLRLGNVFSIGTGGFNPSFLGLQHLQKGLFMALSECRTNKDRS
jgi:hypothetical protein